MNLIKVVTSLTFIFTAVLGNLSIVTAEEHKSNGTVEFIENNDSINPINPVNPTDPGVDIDPIDPTNPDGETSGTSGPLSLDFVSSLIFGKNKISNIDQNYFANAQKLKDGDYVANFVQVTDSRPGNLGWILTVQQEGQFNNATTENKVLTGSVIKLLNGTVNSNSTALAAVSSSMITLDPEGSSSIVMSAEKGAGWGTWIDYFGIVTDEIVEGNSVKKNKSVILDVPGKTPKDAVQYRTSLTWTLTDTPGNV